MRAVPSECWRGRCTPISGWSDSGNLEFSRDALNGTISPIDPIDKPKGVRYDSSHDPGTARDRPRQHGREAAGRVRAWPLAPLVKLGPLACAVRRAGLHDSCAWLAR